MIKLLYFWILALRHSLAKGEFVYAFLSGSLPAAAIQILYKHVAAFQHVSWMQWLADHATEVYVGMALLFIVLHLLHAPYHLYRELERKLIDDRITASTEAEK